MTTSFPRRIAALARCPRREPIACQIGRKMCLSPGCHRRTRIPGRQRSPTAAARVAAGFVLLCAVRGCGVCHRSCLCASYFSVAAPASAFPAPASARRARRARHAGRAMGLGHFSSWAGSSRGVSFTLRGVGEVRSCRMPFSAAPTAPSRRASRRRPRYRAVGELDFVRPRGAGWVASGERTRCALLHGRSAGRAADDDEAGVSPSVYWPDCWRARLFRRVGSAGRTGISSGRGRQHPLNGVIPGDGRGAWPANRARRFMHRRQRRRFPQWTAECRKNHPGAGRPDAAFVAFGGQRELARDPGSDEFEPPLRLAVGDSCFQWLSVAPDWSSPSLRRRLRLDPGTDAHVLPVPQGPHGPTPYAVALTSTNSPARAGTARAADA